MKLISGSSNPTLATSIANQLGIEQLETEIGSFTNGEKRVWIKDSVRGENVVIVQSLTKPVDEHIIELLLITDALERLGARHVNLIMPWFGYSLQDKVFRTGEPLSAKVIANLISNSHIKRAYLLEVHNTSIAGFFSLPTHHLSGLSLFVNHAKKSFDLSKTIVASPDFGGLKRAWLLAEELGVELVKIDKRRNLNSGKIVNMELHGEVKNKTVLVYDDVIVSGGTVIEAAEALQAGGAAEVHFMATHALLVGEAKQKIENPAVSSIITSNSIYHADLPKKCTILDSAPIFVEQLKCWM